jgi:hypothetical protein
VIADALHSTHRHVHANRTHHSSYGIVKLNTIKSDVNLGCSSRCHLRRVGAGRGAAAKAAVDVGGCVDDELRDEMGVGAQAGTEVVA